MYMYIHTIHVCMYIHETVVNTNISSLEWAEQAGVFVMNNVHKFTNVPITSY